MQASLSSHHDKGEVIGGVVYESRDVGADRYPSFYYDGEYRCRLGGIAGQADAPGDSGGTHHLDARWTTAGSAPHRTETR